MYSGCPAQIEFNCLKFFISFKEIEIDIMKKIKEVKDKFVKKKETTSEEISKNPKLDALMKEKEQATAKGEPWVAVLDTKINEEGNSTEGHGTQQAKRNSEETKQETSKIH